MKNLSFAHHRSDRAAAQAALLPVGSVSARCAEAGHDRHHAKTKFASF